MLLKILCYINYLRIKIFLKEGGSVNLMSPFTSFINKKNISIGNNNKFNKNSKIISHDDNSFLKIGDRNVFDSNATVNSHMGYIIIGNDNFIGPNTILQGMGGLEIGSNCMIAGNTFISCSNHDYSEPLSDNYLKNEIGRKVIINDRVWIGANCVITAGVNIGKCSIVGAGSVVVKNVLPFTVIGGVPAKEIKHFDLNLKKWISSY